MLLLYEREAWVLFGFDCLFEVLLLVFFVPGTYFLRRGPFTTMKKYL